MSIGAGSAMIESTGAPGLAASSVASRSALFGATVEVENLIRGDTVESRARFGDENGFLYQQAG